MSKSMTITLLGLTFVATNAFAQYADHPVLLGQSWGPDAQIFSGQSASEAAREKTAGKSAVGSSTGQTSPDRPAAATSGMEDFFRWNDLGARNGVGG